MGVSTLGVLDPFTAFVADVSDGNFTMRGVDRDGDGLPDSDEVSIYHTDPADPDTDGDQMPDGWEVNYGLAPRTNDAHAHSDTDQFDNLSEYTADTDPTNSSSLLSMTSAYSGDDTAVVVWKGGQEAVQILQRRADLASTGEQWIGIHTSQPPTPTTNQFIDAQATNRAFFYRIQAARPPWP